MEITKKESFIRQLALYVRNKEDNKAYDLAREFASKHPDEMVSHYLLAKSALAIQRYKEARIEARKAFNMCRTFDDMLAAALVASSAHFQLREYDKGYALLKEMEKTQSNEDLQMALILFSHAMKKEEEALSHIEKLYRLNQKMAMDLANRIIGK